MKMDKGMCSREVIIENYRKCPRGSKFHSECLCSLWDELTIIISFTLAPCFLASRVNYLLRNAYIPTVVECREQKLNTDDLSIIIIICGAGIIIIFCEIIFATNDRRLVQELI